MGYKEFDCAHWQQCKSEKSWLFINISHRDAINCSPYSFPPGKYSLSELRWQWFSLNGTVEISSLVNEPIQWHQLGMSHPMLEFDNSIQINLWKLAHAWYPLKYEKES